MKQLLYVTHSAGYRHEVLPYSHEVVKKIGAEAGAFEATCTEDVATVDWGGLDRYDAIAFCTTGELPVSEEAKRNLIETVRIRAGVAPLWYLHLRRLAGSCKALGIPLHGELLTPGGGAD